MMYFLNKTTHDKLAYTQTCDNISVKLVYIKPYTNVCLRYVITYIWKIKQSLKPFEELLYIVSIIYRPTFLCVSLQLQGNMSECTHLSLQPSV